MASEADRQRWREAKRRQRAGETRTPAPCGTEAGYRRHLRNEGKPVTCAPCLKALADVTAARRNTR